MLDGQRIIKVMKDNGYRVLARNVVYIGSCDSNGDLYPQAPDEWNDIRLIVSDKGEVIFKQAATIRPGQYYMDNPMNADGCALVAYGQHRDGWTFGTHGHSFPHDALVQCNDIRVHRVNDGSFSRASEPRWVGAECGINNHSTYPGYDGGVGNWSAGCLVGLDFEGHERFIQLLSDSGRVMFDVTLLPWRLVFGDGLMNEGVAPLVR
jgi:hypothetical protein